MSNTTSLRLALFLGWLAAGSASLSHAAEAAVAAEGALYGRLLDAATRQPVAGAQIYITETGRVGFSHEDGHFSMLHFPPGYYTLRTFRIGYAPTLTPLHIAEAETQKIEILMTSTPLSLAEVVVTSDSERTGLPDPARLPVQLAGQKLRQQLGKTIAETIADEPGMDQRTMGPAPARPILRGLSGDRLLVMEDGERTGDLSATSADHAVAIEPLGADRIKVIRGPETLLYGANAVAGIVDVERGVIPSTRIDHPHAVLKYQGETVNQGNSLGLNLWSPLGPLSLRMDGVWRRAGDLQTPEGPLLNTGIRTKNTSAGVSWAGERGYFGVAGSAYQSGYGIPGGFIGAHPRGVDITMDRYNTQAEGVVRLEGSPARQIETRTSYSRYTHEEYESSGLLGIEFGVLTWHLSAIARLRDHGVLRNGVIGFWGEYRDFAAGGLVFTPPTLERSAAGFAYQEIALGRMGFSAGLRYDLKRVDPAYEKLSPRIGLIHARRFANLAGAFSGYYRIREGWELGTLLMRSHRAPGIEELFSEGPHLAAYAFEVGNPELQEEKGISTELFMSYRHASGEMAWSLFQYRFTEYIFPRNTGEMSYRTLLPIYQFTGLDAVMSGGEFRFEWLLHRRLALAGALSYVQGTFRDDDQPMPWMPPLNGRLELRYHFQAWTFGLTLHAASAQERLGEFEERTAGFAVADLSAQYSCMIAGRLNTLDLGCTNLTDTDYRRHLSRVKSILPEPGRNFRILYILYL
jgi:iron complex outermembrane receptor protein